MIYRRNEVGGSEGTKTLLHESGTEKKMFGGNTRMHHFTARSVKARALLWRKAATCTTVANLMSYYCTTPGFGHVSPNIQNAVHEHNGRVSRVATHLATELMLAPDHHHQHHPHQHHQIPEHHHHHHHGRITNKNIITTPGSPIQFHCNRALVEENSERRTVHHVYI